MTVAVGKNSNGPCFILNRKLEFVFQNAAAEKLVGKEARLISDKALKLKLKQTLKTGATHTCAGSGFFGKAGSGLTFDIAPFGDMISVTAVSTEPKEISTPTDGDSAMNNLINQFNFPFVGFDKNLNYVFFNNQMAIDTNVKVSQAIGRNLLELFPAFKGSPLVKKLKATIKSKKVHQVDTNYAPPGEEENIWENTMFPYNGGVMSLSQKVTSTRLAEAKVKASEERWRCVFECSPAINIILQTDLSIDNINPATERFLGANVATVIGNNIADDYLTPESRQVIREEVKRIKRGLKSRSFVLQANTRYGDQRSILCSLSIVRELASKNKNLQLWATDITEIKEKERELRQSEEKLRIISENTNVFILRVNKSGIITYTNKTWESLYKRELMIGTAWAEWWPEKERPAARDKINSFFHDKQANFTWRFEMSDLDGTSKSYLAQISHVIHNGDEGYLVVTNTDITEEAGITKKLEKQKEQMTAIITSSPDGIFAYDKDIRYIFWNPAMERISGIKEKDILGRSPFEVFPFLDNAGEGDAFRRAARGEKVIKSEMRYEIAETGRSGYFESSHVPLITDGKVVGGLAFIRDVTDRKEAIDKTEELLGVDYLTGIYNRRGFFEELNKEVSRAKRYRRAFSLVMLDIDNFKQLNDELGHQAGDKALISIATSISETIRPSDTAGRYGGDEIMVIMPETDNEKARDIAGRLCRRVAKTPTELNLKIRKNLSMSAGVATFPQHGNTIDSLVRAADEALGIAKKSRRGRAVTFKAA